MKKILATILTATIMLTLPVISVSAAETAPIAAYDFEDAANLGKDITGKGNDLTVKGKADQFAEGKAGKALKLNYEGALVASVDASNVDFVDKLDTGSKEITLMYWIKYDVEDFTSWDSSIGWRRIVSNGQDNSAGKGGFAMISRLNNYTTFEKILPQTAFNSETAAGNAITKQYDFTTDWHHIAYTVNCNTGKVVMYVNGQLHEEKEVAGLKDGGALSNLQRAFAIGANYYTDAEGADVFNHSYAGELDSFYVFDKALSADQVTYYMNNGYTPGSGSATGSTGAPSTGDVTGVVALVMIPAAMVLGSSAVVLSRKKK